MPAPSTLDELIAACSTRQLVTFGGWNGNASTSVVGYPISSWRYPQGSQPRAAASPPTGVGEACSGSTVGAAPLVAPGAGEALYLLSMAFASSISSGFTLADRLVHTSGLSSTSVAAQAVNSAALPARGGTGEGVELWIEVYATTGNTGRQITASYTNQAGVAGRTATGSSLSLPVAARPGLMSRLTLQADDTGVQSVQTVTLSGSTGTVGDFGVTLLRRICSCPGVALGSMAGIGPSQTGLAPVDSDACLFGFVQAGSSVAPIFEAEATLVAA